MSLGPTYCNIEIQAFILGEGCHQQFPYKSVPGKCQRCQHLVGKTEAQQAEIRAVPQCTGCGIIAKNLPYPGPPPLCGPCYDRDNGIAPTGTNSTLGNATAIRFKKTGLQAPAASTSLAAIPVTPTVPLSTAAMENARHQGRESDWIHIDIGFAINGTKDTAIGFIRRRVSSTEFMEELMTELLNHFNLARKPVKPFTRREVWFRGRGNVILDLSNDDTKYPLGEFDPEITVGELHTLLKRSSQADTFCSGWKGAPKLGPNAKFIVAEFHIERVTPKGGKRKATESLATSQMSKRLRQIEVASQFSKSSYYCPAPSTKLSRDCKTIIQITSAPKIHEESGEIIYGWQEETVTASIEKQLKNSGRMKKVFLTHIQSPGPAGLDPMLHKPLAFKCFYAIDQEHSQVTIDDNAQALVFEYERAIRGRLALDEFMRVGKEKSIHMDYNIVFTDCYLAREVLDDTDTKPSVASGCSRELADASEHSITWLCEPWHTGAPERFSGTTHFKPMRDEDLLHDTIHAFTHYAYHWSKKDLVFADIQGSYGKLPDGRSGTILYDVMTHSTDGTTGVGDFGRIGHQKFQLQHNCGRICKEIGIEEDLSFGLDGGDATRDGDSESDEDE
ncbi:hypothetical protein PM082_007512 [Marasmius tenuissimus]|nr:hypothetical protein PM082_007512 [Marasmius tenuissimus]